MTTALSIVWNPSEGINLGFFVIRYYSLMFVVAFGLGWYIMKKIFDRENEPIEKLDSLFIWTVFATLLGARLGHVFFYDWEYYRNHLMEILLPFRFSPNFEFTGFQGMASHGAAIAIIISMYFFSKKILAFHQVQGFRLFFISCGFNNIYSNCYIRVNSLYLLFKYLSLC